MPIWNTPTKYWIAFEIRKFCFWTGHDDVIHIHNNTNTMCIHIYGGIESTFLSEMDVWLVSGIINLCMNMNDKLCLTFNRKVFWRLWRKFLNEFFMSKLLVQIMDYFGLTLCRGDGVSGLLSWEKKRKYLEKRGKLKPGIFKKNPENSGKQYIWILNAKSSCSAHQMIQAYNFLRPAT